MLSKFTICSYGIGKSGRQSWGLYRIGIITLGVGNTLGKGSLVGFKGSVLTSTTWDKLSNLAETALACLLIALTCSIKWSQESAILSRFLLLLFISTNTIWIISFILDICSCSWVRSAETLSFILITPVNKWPAQKVCKGHQQFDYMYLSVARSIFQTSLKYPWTVISSRMTQIKGTKGTCW